MRLPAAHIPFPREDLDQSIPNRFERQAQLYPTRPAVAFAGRFVTYQELDQQANRIANTILNRIGTAPGPVALLLGQGIPLIAAILGVLKAGRAYLPLSETGAESLLEEVMVEAGAVIILVDEPTRALGQRIAGVVPVVDLDRRLSESDGSPDIRLGADEPASLYYTSGSTGRPKGVVDTHRNILHNVLRYTNTLGISRDDRLTLLQGTTFSGAMSSMFGALLNGACLCPWDVPRHTPGALARFLVEHRLTMYHSVPTIFRSLLSEGIRFPDLRVIRLEGDQATHRDVELFRRHFDRDTGLVNGLGTTETGLIRQYFVDHDTPVDPGILPVGQPVIDMEVRLLDERAQPLGAGETGEIAVISRYLAPGYWRRPELTAEAFLTPAGSPGDRMYRTGDLGRFRSDGCLEYLGRRDSRVKIRGQSVHLADVESVLVQHPAVREAAVVANTGSDGEQRLVGYLVPRDGRPQVDQLRHQLEQSLPAHAIPARFVLLDALPLTDNRKIDRSALTLAPPSAVRPELSAGYAEATNALESLLVHIWEELLDLRPVGIRDEFLALGGDSLLAVHMIERVERALGRSISLGILVRARTIEELARALVSEQPPDLRAPVVRLNGEGTRAPFYFLHGDYWSDGLYCLHAASHLPSDQPFTLLPPLGLDGGAVPLSVEAMAKRHLSTLRAVQPTGPYRLGGNCNGGMIAFEMARLLRHEGEEIELLILVRASGRTLHLRLHDLVARGIAATGLAKGGGDRVRWRKRVHEFTEEWEKASAAGKASLVWQKILNLPRLVRRPPVPPESDPSISQENQGDSWREGLRDIYMQAARNYLPGPYDRPVTLFWPETDTETPEEAASWWRKVAPTVELQVLPGDHLTYATVHVAEFARQLMARLD